MKNTKKITALGLAVLALTATFGFGACGKDKAEEITVYMPDGAPALAMASLMAADTPDDGVTYRVVDASLIATKISANDMKNNADLCVLPVNLASKQLGGGDKYRMLGLVTQGNMYLISDEEVENVDELSALTGETVGLAQISNVPGLTLKAALNRNGLAWQELKDGTQASSEKVNLKALADNTAVDGTLSYYLAAEPFVTTKTASGQFRVVGDLQTLYNGALSEEVGYPQAVLVAKSDFLGQNAAWTWEFLKKLSVSDAWLETASAQDIYDSVVNHFEDENHKAVFNQNTLTKECISRCGISFAYAKDCYPRVNAFLAELTQINPNAASAVEEDFYWLG